MHKDDLDKFVQSICSPGADYERALLFFKLLQQATGDFFSFFSSCFTSICDPLGYDRPNTGDLSGPIQDKAVRHHTIVEYTNEEGAVARPEHPQLLVLCMPRMICYIQAWWLNGYLLSYGTLGIREVFSARAGIENFCSC